MQRPTTRCGWWVFAILSVSACAECNCLWYQTEHRRRQDTLHHDEYGCDRDPDQQRCSRKGARGLFTIPHIHVDDNAKIVERGDNTHDQTDQRQPPVTSLISSGE